MQTNLDLFLELPLDIMIKCLYNTITFSGEKKLLEKNNCLSDAITGSFIWSCTEEGDSYWNEICYSYSFEELVF